MKPIPKILSKSRILKGYQCPKALYLSLYHPEKKTPVSEELQDRFDQGHEVGCKARELLFPKGVLVDCKAWEFRESVEKTKQFISHGAKTIYEAAFLYQGAYARLDIINYCEKSNRWSLYEVKSTTKVKEEHIKDVTLSSWITAESGLKIEKIYLVHLNPNCAFPDLSALFKKEDVTDLVRENYRSVPKKLKEIAQIIKEEKTPEISIGAHCFAPYECDFKSHCWEESKVPKLSVLDFYKFDDKWDCFKKGIVDIDDDRLFNLKSLSAQQRQILKCHRTGEVFKNPKSIRADLSSWSYPFVFLDFETFNPAIPKFNKTSPFSIIPFQFSAHILRDKDSDLEHYEFLHDKEDDPRPPLIEKLLEVCGKEGSVIAYYKSFEINRIKDLAEFSSEQKKDLLEIVERMEDPLPTLRANFYDPKFECGFSLKKVAPALLGKNFSYEAMEIGEGRSAQRAYKKLISPDIKPEEKEIIKKYLLEYCKRDTESLAQIVKFLFEQI